MNTDERITVANFILMKEYKELPTAIKHRVLLQMVDRAYDRKTVADFILTTEYKHLPEVIKHRVLFQMTD